MELGNPISTLAAALHSALLRDLPDIPEEISFLGGVERTHKAHRPAEYNVELYMFPETWPSTALGYGGMGGQMITSAYTVIVVCRVTDAACVYWGGGRLGRLVDAKEALRMVGAQNTKSTRSKSK